MSLLKKANIITTPTAYSEGKLHSVKPEIALGPELVVNGGFDTDSDWTKQSNWTISGGKANSNGSGLIYQTSVSYVDGKTYMVTFNADITSGTGTVRLGNTSAELYFANGYNEFYLQTSASNTTRYIFFQGNSLVGSIDNVSVKEDISADFDFTRGSSATRVNEAGLIESVAANLPRINYENGIGHLLLEPQRTNLVTYSENFTGYWALQNASLIADNQAINPSGETFANKLNTSSTSAFSSLNRSESSAWDSKTLTVSCFAKKITSDYIFFYNIGSIAGTNGTWFNINNGTVGATGSGFTNAKVENYGNGWYRCSAEITFGTGTNYLYISNSDGNGNTTSTIGSQTYIWGTQLEEGSYPTSYIVSNSGSATTRLAETCNNAGNSDIIPSDEGVLYFEGSALADDGTSRCISIFQNVSNLIKFQYSPTSNRVDFVATSSGVVSCNITKVITNTTENAKFGLRWKLNDFSFWINGVEVGTDLSGNTPIGMDKISFTNEGSSGNFYGKTRMVAVFPYLSNDELECLTGEGYASFEALAAAYNYTTI
jgi:hypothetical protein